ncbi:hypothetical protein ACFE04_029849 [Oxalis oulophora]
MDHHKSNKFTWKVVNFTKLKTKKKHYSTVFTLAGYNWRIVIYPKGNKVDCLSMYLDVCDSNTLPLGWSIDANFNLAVVNQINDNESIMHDTAAAHFHAGACTQGYTSFMPLATLNDPDGGYIVNDALVIEAEIVVSTNPQLHDQDNEMLITEDNCMINEDMMGNEICFDEMATALLAKLEDDKVSVDVRFSDFVEIKSNNYVDVGVFKVPANLESIANQFLARHPDIGTGNSVDYVNNITFIVLCSTLKSMDTTSSNKITETLILKWMDAIRAALHFGFKVDFLKNHLKSVTQAYLAKSTRNSRENKELQAMLTELSNKRKDLDLFTVRCADKDKKVNTELRKICEAEAAKFPGETYSYFSN